ncbi:CRISPR-associated endoribonuclease Cas6 [Metallosphaera hakonensis]|nr:CRISPR-associated endoribonuclease Cas6 [Metallosphaera hakonensis]
MRICMSFSPKGPVPLHYNYLVQSAIYNRLPKRLSNTLHDKGIMEGPRRFKMFTFSKLMGDFKREGDHLIYIDRCFLCISSPLDRVIKEIYRSFLVDPDLILGRSKLVLEVINVVQDPEFRETNRVYTLSPIAVYRRNGNQTRYYNPFELEWGSLVDLNARRKFLALEGRNLRNGLSVRPLRAFISLVRYKDNVVEAWRGEFIMRGPKSLQRVVYETGLGSKNSQGFGMVEMVGRNVREFLNI